MLRKRAVLAPLVSVLIIAGMAGLTAAAVPLYNWFCRVTGYGGTTSVASETPAEISDQTITVRFNADTMPGLPWRFKPLQAEMTVNIGANNLAFYEAVNTADRPVTGQAGYNVTPHQAGYYFSKIHCFCFEEQTLEPGQRVEMPVSFYVDPAILDDIEARDISAITLSYTFFPKGEVATTAATR